MKDDAVRIQAPVSCLSGVSVPLRGIGDERLEELIEECQERNYWKFPSPCGELVMKERCLEPALGNGS